MRTLVSGRGEHGARTLRSHGATVHGHARLVSRRAVPTTMGADFRAAGRNASADQDQHQRPEQEPQARRGSQEQPFPHEAQDNSGHVPRAALSLYAAEARLMTLSC
jgi:hypothetical protein